MNAEIVIVTMDLDDTDLVTWLVKRLSDLTDKEVTCGGNIRLPLYAFNPQRGQYSGEALLTMLQNTRTPNTQSILGLINADCYADRLNYIFGLAIFNGGEALVALPHLRSGSNGSRPSQTQIYERVLKESMHELGHNWGLDHCANRLCVMHFSSVMEDTDYKQYTYCERCDAALHAYAR